jgi:hypothetical protein
MLAVFALLFAILQLLLQISDRTHEFVFIIQSILVHKFILIVTNTTTVTFTLLESTFVYGLLLFSDIVYHVQPTESIRQSVVVDGSFIKHTAAQV